MDDKQLQTDTVTKLLDAWVTRCATGETPTIAELCRGHEQLIPELERRIEQKKLVDEIVEEWEDLIVSGCTPRVEDLCVEHPELIELVRTEIEALKKFDSLFGSIGESLPPAEEMSEFCGGRYEIQGLHASGGLG